MHIEAILYVLIGISGSTGIGAMLAGDEALKYIPQPWLFYFKCFDALVFGASMQLKTFRSTAFATYKAENGVKKEEAK